MNRILGVPAQRAGAGRLFVPISAKEAAEDFHCNPSRGLLKRMSLL